MSSGIPKYQHPGAAPFLTLPSWLVRAFGDCHAAALGKDLSSIGCGTLLPVLSPLQLQSLTLVVAEMQEQLLAQKNSQDPLIHLQPNAFPARTSLLQQLGGLKFLHAIDNEQLVAFPLFKNERWYNEGSQQVNLQLHLELEGPELLFGLVNGPFELTRRVVGRPGIKPLLAGQAPFPIMRALWLDLDEIEQGLLLQVHQASKKEKNLGGVVALPLHELMIASASGKALSFAQKLLILQRLAKKLYTHGYLQHAETSRYCEQEISGGALQALWPIAAAHHGDILAQTNLPAINKLFARHACAQLSPDGAWFSIISAGLPWENCRKFAAKIAKVVRLLPWEQENEAHFSLLDGNVLVDPVFLFLEWTMRALPGHPLPLPSALAAVQNITLLPHATDSEDEIAKKFRLCVDGFALHGQSAALLSEKPLFTLMAEISQKSTTVTQLLTLVAQKYSGELPAREPFPLQEAGARAEVSASQVNPSFKLKQKFTGMKIRQLGEPQDFKQQSVAKIKASSQEKYHSLVTHYFNSLAQPSQQIVLNMKKRLPPQQFEQHLMKRLVRFVADNPDYSL